MRPIHSHKSHTHNPINPLPLTKISHHQQSKQSTTIRNTATTTKREREREREREISEVWKEERSATLGFARLHVLWSHFLWISESKPKFLPNLGLVDMNRVGSSAIIPKFKTLSTTLYRVKVAKYGSDGCCKRRERREKESER